MKVLVISHMYPSNFNEISGIFVHEQVKALVAKGVEIQVVSPVPWTPFPINYLSSKWKKYNNTPERTVYGGISIWYPQYLTFPRAWFFASSGQRMYLGIKDVVSKIYKEFQFDLIHAHVALPDGFAALKIKKIYYKPVIVNIHGQDLQQTLYKNSSCKTALFYVFKQADKIITVSNKLKRIAKENFGFAKKIITIGDGVQINKLILKRNNISKIGNYNYRTILSVSNLILQKGIDYNLKSFAKLVDKYNNLRYLIIGDGPEMKRLKELSHNLGINKQVEFLGKLSHENVLVYMAKADIFSLPSWNEGFGVVYIEAMAQGKPIIGCQGEGIEDFVENGKTGLLVKPKDVDNLAKALGFLLRNIDEAKIIGERAQKFVLENYTWEKNAEKTIEIYREVLNNAC